MTSHYLTCLNKLTHRYTGFYHIKGLGSKWTVKQEWDQERLIHCTVSINPTTTDLNCQKRICLPASQKNIEIRKITWTKRHLVTCGKLGNNKQTYRVLRHQESSLLPHFTREAATGHYKPNLLNSWNWESGFVIPEKAATVFSPVTCLTWQVGVSVKGACFPVPTGANNTRWGRVNEESATSTLKLGET